MSGGSYDYMYLSAPEKLRGIASELGHMADRCDERASGGPEIDWKTKQPIDMSPLSEVAKYLRTMSIKIGRQATVLETWKEVLHDIEWWASGDSGPESVLESFDELPRMRADDRVPAMSPSSPETCLIVGGHRWAGVRCVDCDTQRAAPNDVSLVSVAEACIVAWEAYGLFSDKHPDLKPGSDTNLGKAHAATRTLREALRGLARDGAT